MYSYKYPMAALTVDAIVFVKKEENTMVLLIQRGREPYKEKWALPGGFIDMNETLEQSCIRELYEETGLQISELKQFRTYDAVDRDPRHRTISVVFYTKLDLMKEVEGRDDAAQAGWFSITELPELAFDHAKILSDFFKL